MPLPVCSVPFCVRSPSIVTCPVETSWSRRPGLSGRSPGRSSLATRTGRALFAGRTVAPPVPAGPCARADPSRQWQRPGPARRAEQSRHGTGSALRAGGHRARSSGVAASADRAPTHRLRRSLQRFASSSSMILAIAAVDARRGELAGSCRLVSRPIAPHRPSPGSGRGRRRARNRPDLGRCAASRVDSRVDSMDAPLGADLMVARHLHLPVVPLCRASDRLVFGYAYRTIPVGQTRRSQCRPSVVPSTSSATTNISRSGVRHGREACLSSPSGSIEVQSGAAAHGGPHQAARR